jgi:hypothetical protein
MVAYFVATGLQLGKQMGVIGNIIAHAKKGGLGLVAIQNIQYPIGNTGCGAIVKGKV